MKVAILANGIENDEDLLRAELMRANRTICADGGFRRAMQLGWIPDSVVGDLDSLGPQETVALEAVHVVRGRIDKDQSDLEMALDLAKFWEATDVVLLGALDGRIDHMLFNLISCLCYSRKLGLATRVKGSRLEAFLVDRYARIEEREGWLCSLLSLEEETVGVTLKGFQYPLEDGTLYRHSTRGLSNRIQSPTASIKLQQGLLLAQLSSMNG
jgi:thiamine pyrophosphokinase